MTRPDVSQGPRQRTGAKEELDAVAAWVEQGGWDGRLVRSLSVFLDATAADSRSPAERLRKLAVEVEARAASWNVLAEIYQAANLLEPENSTVLQSWGIAAQAQLEGVQGSVEVAECGLRALDEAQRLDPGDAETVYAKGLIHYFWPGRESCESLEHAKVCFSDAIDLDPGHQMARLYFAHCLHDACDWQAAAGAYEAIDFDALARNWPSWRAIKATEQQANCLAFAGRVEAARDVLHRLFTVIEAMPDEVLHDEVCNLDEAAEALAGPVNDPELRSRALAIVVRLGEAGRYPGLAEER